MKVKSFCSFIAFFSVLRISVQMDLLTPYQEQYAARMKNIGPLFNQDKVKRVLPRTEQFISPNCFADLKQLFAVENHNESAKFFDAWGSRPAGLLYGQDVGFGNYEECESATVPLPHSNREVHGKYALVKPVLRSNDSIRARKELFGFGICLPQTCNASDVYVIFAFNFYTVNKLLDLFGESTVADETESPKINFIVLNTKTDITIKDRRAASFGTFVFSLIFMLVVLSSCYELIVVRMQGNPHPLLKSFSVFTNCTQIFQIKPRNSLSPKIIECVNGIRSLSLIWNIFGHTYMWSIPRSDTNGPQRIQVLTEVFGRALTTANLSVDAFLLLSGLLVAWIGLHRMSREHGRMSIKLMYLHRYLRITPSYAATVLFAAGLHVYAGDGPLWYHYSLLQSKRCQKYWWSSLIYISNYYNFGEMCIGHDWFLAVDMQLYICSPCILVGLWKWPRKTIGILAFLVLVSRYCVYAAIMRIGQKGFVFDEMIMKDSEFDPVHYRTEMRMSSWIIGVVLGFILFKNRNRSRRHSSRLVLLGWCVTLLVMALFLLGPQRLYERHIEPSPLESALYESIGRYCWVLGLAWVIFSCHSGYSESINAFLSHEIWQIVAKLNYTIYLVKTFININNLAMQKTPAHFSHYDMIAEFWSDFGISATFAVILSLSLELPFLAIQKYFESNSQPSKNIV